MVQGEKMLHMLEVCEVSSQLPPKTDENDKTHRNDVNTLYLDIWSMLLLISA